MIDIQSLTFRYDGAERDALRDITLTVPDGAFLGIIGPAGAGKTTLAHCMSGIIPHAVRGDFYGAVKVDGLDTADNKLTDLSRLVGTVFQEVESQIVSSVVEDELLYGLENFGVPREEIEDRIVFALEKVGIAPLRHRTISSLSGGQRQKVAIASLVALRPKILVLDEPTGELDPRSSRQIFTLLTSLNRDYGMTVVVVEQKIMLLCEFAERLAVLSEGRIVREGTVREVLGDIAGLEEIGVNCPRSALLSSLLAEKTGREVPVCVNADEAVETARRFIG
jgi:energy-coupling factor transporter ATP-binding protein EcfA2